MTDYQRFQSIINTVVKQHSRPSLLLHSCCGPCSTYVLQLLNQYFDITIYYYNPNIYPVGEYQKRLTEQIKVMNQIQPEHPINMLNASYDELRYEVAINGFEEEPEGGKRCYLCYQMRLTETAKKAHQLGFDYFTTTISISPYKNSEWLNEIGKELEQQYKVAYLVADFKKQEGYKQSITLSKQYDLYRQTYCGCKYSFEKEKIKFNVI